MRAIYWIVGGIVVVLMVAGVIAFSPNAESRQAERKAEELTQRFEEAGLPVPQDQTILTRVLGTDGGAVCEQPMSALGKARLLGNLSNGASFVGQRPVVVDGRILQGELLILDVYCPDKLDPYRERIEELKTDDVNDL